MEPTAGKYIRVDLYLQTPDIFVLVFPKLNEAETCLVEGGIGRSPFMHAEVDRDFADGIGHESLIDYHSVCDGSTAGNRHIADQCRAGFERPDWPITASGKRRLLGHCRRSAVDPRRSAMGRIPAARSQSSVNEHFLIRQMRTSQSETTPSDSPTP